MKPFKSLIGKNMHKKMYKQSFGKQLSDNVSDAGQAIKGGSQRAGKAMQSTAQSTAQNFPKNALVMNDKRGAHLGNLYTGKKLNGYTIGGAAAAGTLGVAGGVQGLVGEKKAIPESASDMSLFDIQGVVSKPVAPAESATSPVMMADGSAGAAPTKTNAPNLNASGDIVFGMHNQRRK